VTFPRAALADLVAQLSGVECIWPDQANGQVGATGRAQAWIELSFGADTGEGDGEYRQTVDPNNAAHLCTRVVLPSLLTISMRAKSNDADVQAGELLKTVRWKLRGVTAAAFYKCENVAMVRTHPIAIFRGTPGARNRARLDATMDVVFRSDAGGVPKDDPGAVIASINSGGTIPFTPSG
jgi:hypothetical protein